MVNVYTRLRDTATLRSRSRSKVEMARFKLRIGGFRITALIVFGWRFEESVFQPRALAKTSRKDAVVSGVGGRNCTDVEGDEITAAPAPKCSCEALEARAVELTATEDGETANG